MVMVPSPSLSNKANASLNSVICSSVSSAAIVVISFFNNACAWSLTRKSEEQLALDWINSSFFFRRGRAARVGGCVFKKYPNVKEKALSLAALSEQRACGCVSSCIKSIFTTVCKCMSLSFFLSLSRSFVLLDAHREQQRRLLILLLLLPLLLPLRRERGGETFSISGAFA